MEVHAADQYLVAPGEAGLLEAYEALEGTGLFPPFPPVELPGGVEGLVARGGFAQTFFFPAEVLGLTFRTPKGEVVRAGGLVVKNVQGYDLVRPFVGSFGLLGEALEVVFRLRPGRAFAFLKRPWKGVFPELSPRPRFLFALEDALYAFHYGHEKEVARFREAFLGEEVGPLDLRSLFPRGMGVGEGPLRDLRFAWKDGGEAPRPPEAFLRWVRGMGYPL
jgi:glycolate oxidase FAD binding subunit